MADKPILFSAPMICAILDGRKTQTRRVIKPQPPFTGGVAGVYRPGPVGIAIYEETLGCRPSHFLPAKFLKGDRLWVREAWSGEYVFHDISPSRREPMDTGNGTAAFPQTVHYWADGSPKWGDWERPRPSIHMPRWASRLTLAVTDVRVQRIQDISEEDAVAEGCQDERIGMASMYSLGGRPRFPVSAISEFRSLWNSINGPDAWAANPWVVALTFDVHKCNIDQMPARDAVQEVRRG